MPHASYYSLYHKATKKQERNSPCDCGSGKKHKKCCFNISQDLRIQRIWHLLSADERCVVERAREAREQRLKERDYPKEELNEGTQFAKSLGIPFLDFVVAQFRQREAEFFTHPAYPGKHPRYPRTRR